MKKLIALLLVAVFVSTGIVGCGGETTPKKSEPPKTAPGGAGGGGAKP